MDLFALIHSMSKGDKRHFSIVSNSKAMHSKKYFSLYKAILDQKYFDEKTLKKKFGSKYYPQLKHELSKHVLDSLRRNYLKTEEASALLKISNAHVLLNNSLWTDALNQIKKPSLMSLSDIAYIKSRCCSIQEIEQTLHKWDNQSDKLMDKLKTENKYDKLYLTITLINQQIESVRDRSDRDKLIEFLNEPLFKKASYGTSKDAQLNFYYCKGLAKYLLGEFKESYANMLKAKKLMDKNYSLRLKKEDLYIRITANLSLCSIQYKQIDIAVEHQRELSIYTPLFSSNLPYKTYLSDLILLMILNFKKEYAKALTHLGKKIIRSNKNKFQNRLTQENSYEIFQSFTTLIGLKLFKEAKRMILKYILDHKHSSKKDAYAYARILYVVVLIESNDDQLLFSELRSIVRYLKEENKMYGFEKIFTRFAHALLKQNTKQNIRSLYAQFFKEIENLKEDAFERNAFIYFDFASWAENKSLNL